MLSVRKLALSLSCAAAAICHPAAAGEAPGDIELSDLGTFDLETLLNLEVTSASKKHEPLSHSATSIYVITQEDIRRSGFTTLPELFRMVPGMQVARVNASQWAISSRGFNDSYSDKLLVLIDGRTVYTPSFGGVFWSDQDLVLEDLDRVEVIRGPGATLWGANAVNGVINVITKTARETQGLLLSTTYGSLEQPATSLRYGGRLGEHLHYRVFGKYFNHENFESAGGETVGDDWRIGSGELRLDWEPRDSDLFTLEGRYFNSEFGEVFQTSRLTPPAVVLTTTDNHNNGGNLLGRWSHQFSEDSELSLQAYYDQSMHKEFGVAIRQDTYDLEVQHRFPIGDRNEIIWGAGYRYFPDEMESTGSIRWSERETDHQLLSAFLQDGISLIEDRVRLTLGSKFEHNDYTGVEIQPSVRLLYTPTQNQSLWAAASRAVRTPTRADTAFVGDFQVVDMGPGSPPTLIRTYGNPEIESEKVIAYELGYRVQPHQRVSLELATFYNVLRDFRRFANGVPFLETDPAPAHIVVPAVAENGFKGASYGGEASLEWMPVQNLRLHAGYSFTEFDLEPDDTLGRSTPEHQLFLRAYVDLPRSVQVMAAANYVDSIWASDGKNYVNIPSYVRADLGITWRPTSSIELGVWGQNLLDPAHPEFTNYRSPQIAEIPRSVLGKVTISY